MRAPRIHAELRTIAMKALSGFTHRDRIRNSREASVQPDEDQPIDVRQEVVTSSAGENVSRLDTVCFAKACGAIRWLPRLETDHQKLVFDLLQKQLGSRAADGISRASRDDAHAPILDRAPSTKRGRASDDFCPSDRSQANPDGASGPTSGRGRATSRHRATRDAGHSRRFHDVHPRKRAEIPTKVRR